jgi:RPA family protein
VKREVTSYTLNISPSKYLITTMEGATRVFAGEYNSATLSVPGSDTRSPAWVVTPGGAWCRLLYLAGALTEVIENGDLVCCRLADPTSTFDLVTGGRRSALADLVRTLEVPSFVTVSGTAQCFRKNSSTVVTVRMNDVQPADRRCRDAWVLETAEMTIARLETLLSALRGTSTDTRACTVIHHYAVTPAFLREQLAMVERAVQGVQPALPGPVARDAPRELVMEIIRGATSPRGIAVQEIIDAAGTRGIPKEATLAAIEALIVDDACYQPQKGYIRLL